MKREDRDAQYKAAFPEGLSCETIDTKPVDVDWSEAFAFTFDGDEPRAARIFPDPDDFGREELERFLADRGGDLPEDEDDPDDYLDELREAVREWIYENPSEYEPVMSYYYPLPSGHMYPQALNAGPVVLVSLDDEPVLALAGGGMDLSWEICGAYVDLGFCPPLHFASNLSRSRNCDQKPGDLSDRDRRIVLACLRSADVARTWAENAVEDAEYLLTGKRPDMDDRPESLVERIHEALLNDGNEWDASIVEDVAAILSDAGYEIPDPNDLTEEEN